MKKREMRERMNCALADIEAALEYLDVYRLKDWAAAMTLNVIEMNMNSAIKDLDLKNK